LGKPFQSELTKLAATYAWALHEDTACLSTFVRESAESDLYVTGSGGSYSAAAFVAFLTQLETGQHGSAVTPLELSSLLHIRRSSVLIFSAGGNNSDILAAFQSAVSREPLALGIVCLRPDSKLARQASLYEFVQVSATTIQYSIDAADRVTQVTSGWVDAQHPATLAAVDPSAGFWPTGAVRKLTLGNNLTEAMVYDSRSRPCRLNVNSSGALLTNCSDALPSGRF
jgi:hypothetical protein